MTTKQMAIEILAICASAGDRSRELGSSYSAGYALGYTHEAIQLAISTWSRFNPMRLEWPATYGPDDCRAEYARAEAALRCGDC